MVLTLIRLRPTKQRLTRKRLMLTRLRLVVLLLAVLLLAVNLPLVPLPVPLALLLVAPRKLNPMLLPRKLKLRSGKPKKP